MTGDGLRQTQTSSGNPRRPQEEVKKRRTENRELQGRVGLFQNLAPADLDDTAVTDDHAVEVL